MKLALPLLVLFGPLVVLVLGYMTMLLVWHHRLNGANLAPEARERIRHRADAFALVVKYSG
jgi:inosine/xanthosine triphosphate pyrophosphatase family protein